MDATLTLALDQQVTESTSDLGLSGTVADLAGIAKGADAEEDLEDAYAAYLTEKYRSEPSGCIHHRARCESSSCFRRFGAT